MKTTAIILSGGRGSRAGGADKGLLPWGEQTMVEAVIGRIQAQVDELLLSCNRNLDQYRSLGYPTVSDALTDFQGPLAGIASALNRINTEIAVVVPCDCPTLPGDLVERLLSPLVEQEVQLSWAHDGERDQYLFTALRRNILPSLEAYLETGNRSVRGWHQSLNCRRVDFADCREAFINLNSF